MQSAALEHDTPAKPLLGGKFGFELETFHGPSPFPCTVIAS